MSELSWANPAPANFEIRSEGGNTVVEGYAALFETETVVADRWAEKVSRGAFSEAIKRDDVAFLVNHKGEPLARRSNGTLDLVEDELGLRMKATLDPSDPDVARIVPKIKNKNLKDMSFAFVVNKEGRDNGQRWTERPGMPLRELREVNLVDVSVVNDPAYPGTSISVRCKQDYENFVSSKPNHSATRLRMKGKLAGI